MINPIFFRHGQQIKEFKICRKESHQDEKGRTVYSEVLKEIGSLKGSISRYAQRENRKWGKDNKFRQLEHSINYVIVVNGKCNAEAEDILILDNEKYYVYGKDNPSELNLFQIIYCEKQTGGGDYV